MRAARSATTHAPRTSCRRSSSPRCAASARSTGPPASSPGSTGSRTTPASTTCAAAAGPRRCPSTPTASPPAEEIRLFRQAPSSHAAVTQKEDFKNLRQALTDLPRPRPQILVLRELEGLSYDEIAVRMSISVSAVESMLFRARRGLRTEYGEISTGERCRRMRTVMAQTVEGVGRPARPAGAGAPPPRLPGLPARRFRDGPRPAARRRAADGPARPGSRASPPCCRCRGSSTAARRRPSRFSAESGRSRRRAGTRRHVLREPRAGGDHARHRDGRRQRRARGHRDPEGGRRVAAAAVVGGGGFVAQRHPHRTARPAAHGREAGRRRAVAGHRARPSGRRLHRLRCPCPSRRWRRARPR